MGGRQFDIAIEVGFHENLVGFIEYERYVFARLCAPVPYPESTPMSNSPFEPYNVKVQVPAGRALDAVVHECLAKNAHVRFPYAATVPVGHS